jgi:urea transporter
MLFPQLIQNIFREKSASFLDLGFVLIKMIVSYLNFLVKHIITSSSLVKLPRFSHKIMDDNEYSWIMFLYIHI